MKISEANRNVGGLSKPSKMPCLGTSTPAQACPIGSKLVNVEGSVCEGCYALKGAYSWRGVKSALLRRLEIVQACKWDPGARERWIDSMAFLLNTRRAAWKPKDKLDHRFFRWHDSGDVQGDYHLEMIIEVARRTPDVKHWLPTRELPTVKRALEAWGEFPTNLVVRLSANRVDGKAPILLGTAGSSVHLLKGSPKWGLECPAIHNDNACGSCRRCWDIDEDVSYLKH